jgi:hypothetical protein
VRRAYGAGAAHLLVAGSSFALAGWALAQAFEVLASPANFLVWLGGAVLAHDLVLFPLYSVIGRSAASAIVPQPSRLRIATLNHLRVPAILSGLTFLIWFPLILGLDPQVFERASGTSNDIYLERWLLLTAALFGGSGLILAMRARRLR